MGNIKLSLIICSKNRCEQLKTCLDYVSNNKPSFEWELLLVDNNSTDHTYRVMHDFMHDHDEIVAKYIFESKLGNGAGRNAAIRQCRGDIIAFTDDDCYVDENWLNNWFKVFKNKNIGYASGRIMLYDQEDYRVTINESMVGIDVSKKDLAPAGMVQGANMCFRKEAIIQAGMFDSDFGAGTPFSGEDWELAMRISADGWRGGYFPDPFVWHHHGRKADAADKLHIYYLIGEGALYAKGMLNNKMRGRIFSMLCRCMKDNFYWYRKRNIYFIFKGMIKYYLRGILREKRVIK